MTSSSTIRKTPSNKAVNAVGKASPKPTAKTAGKLTGKSNGKASEKNPVKTSEQKSANTLTKLSANAVASPADAALAAVAAQSEPSAEPAAAGALKLRDLVDRVVSSTGQPRLQVKKAIEAALAVFGEALDQDQALNLPHLGKIRVGKPGNPAEGQPMVLKIRRDLSSAER
jgi:hypothetical protein